MGFFDILTGNKESPEMKEMKSKYETVNNLSDQIENEVRALLNLNGMKYNADDVDDNKTLVDIPETSILGNNIKIMYQKLDRKTPGNIENESFFKSIRKDNILNDELSTLINQRNVVLADLYNLNQQNSTHTNHRLNHGGGGFTATSERVMINGKQNRIVYKKNGKGVGYVKMNGEFVKMNSKNIKK